MVCVGDKEPEIPSDVLQRKRRDSKALLPERPCTEPMLIPAPTNLKDLYFRASNETRERHDEIPHVWESCLGGGWPEFM